MPSAAETVKLLKLSRLVPSPANVRKTNAKDGIEALAASIKQRGLLNNLTVRAIDGGKFEAVAGADAFLRSASRQDGEAG